MSGAESPRIPSYRCHKPTGLAVVWLDGRDIYLGDHGTPESRERYRHVIAEWLAGYHQPAAQEGSEGRAVLTVNELFLACWRHAQGY
jgi:hypothetical protein